LKQKSFESHIPSNP